MLACLVEFLLQIILAVLLLPVMLVAATPFILVLALFDPEGYVRGVRQRYVRVFEFWATLVSYFP